jgi:hypothetical protein
MSWRSLFRRKVSSSFGFDYTSTKVLRIAFHPRDDFAGIADVRGAKGVVGNEIAMLCENIHYANLVIVQDVLDVGLQRVGHVWILWVWSNASVRSPC